MALLDFRKKAKEQKDSEEFTTEELPEELEKFRTRARFGPPADKIIEPRSGSAKEDEPFLPEEYKKNIDEMPQFKKEIPVEPKQHHEVVMHKLDLILSKLETIDARIKLLEEKLKRFG